MSTLGLQKQLFCSCSLLCRLTDRNALLHNPYLELKQVTPQQPVQLQHHPDGHGQDKATGWWPG